MCYIQDKPQICLKCVSLGSKNTDEEGGEAPHSSSLTPVSPREEDRGCYLCLFSMAAELWLGSLFASRNKFKCEQVSYLCILAVQPLLSACFQSSGIIPEWSPDAAALRPFTWRQLLLNYIPFAGGLAFKSFSIKQDSKEVAAKLC